MYLTYSDNDLIQQTRKHGCYRTWAGPVLGNKQVMGSRLWFLAQATSRFAANSLSRHTARPSFIQSYSVRRFLCADRKSDTFNSTELSDHVDADEADEPSEEVNDSPELLKTPKSDGKLVKQYSLLFNAHP